MKLPTIEATRLGPPPGWALLQRQLFALQEEALELLAQGYCEDDGTPLEYIDADDAYEAHWYRGMLYALGGGERVLEIGKREWEGITRLYEEGRPGHAPQIKDEYYRAPADWFHMGEGNQALYSLALADPGDAALIARSRRFAELYMGPPNYDPQYRIIRSPFHGSDGPFFHAPVEMVKTGLDRYYYGGTPRPIGHAQRANLHPVVRDLEEDWYRDPARQEEIVALFDRVVLNGDIPDNLAATGLVTHAYLLTGEDRFKQWVLDYTQAWMERVAQNNGIIPDNIGPTGQIGEQRQGQWWGGWYGWNSRNSARNAFLAATIASECCQLLTGDAGYLDLIRGQIAGLLERSSSGDDGQLLVPTRITAEGWSEYEPLHLQWLGRLYHASMAESDRALIEQVRDGERRRDWGAIELAGDRSSGSLEARYEYYAGRFPTWPEERLGSDYQYVQAMGEYMRADPRSRREIAAENRWPPNPVAIKGLVQVTTGGPQPVYNGGLLRGLVRYFDGEGRRPGLPGEVAALVDEVGPKRLGVHLVNSSLSAGRTVVLQAGAFGEHDFTEVGFEAENIDQARANGYAWLRGGRQIEARKLSVDGGALAVRLPASTSIRLDIGLARFVRQGSCRPVWERGV